MLRSIQLLALATIVAFLSPARCHGFHEAFGDSWESVWKHSTHSEYTGRVTVEAPSEFSDGALKIPERARKYGVAATLPDGPIDPADGIVVQYELKLTEPLSCGGAYLKFLNVSSGFDPSSLTDTTPYSIMFGPDKCGVTNKVHLIVRHKSPITAEIEEKHLRIPPQVRTDTSTHVYTAVLNADGTYAVLIDGEEAKAGKIHDAFEPSINPPKEIPDPADVKPDDWVDEPRIPDPEAVKPDDWDEDAPAEIADATAERPENWDEEEDGVWEPPMVPNPNYKGPWTPPVIDNPAYKGPWVAAKIPNPDYFEDDTPLKSIGKVGAVALEIWTMDKGIYIDNILVTNDPAQAEELREQLWRPKHEAEEKEKEKALEEMKRQKKTLAAALSAAFDTPMLAPLKPAVQPLLHAMEHRPWLVYVLVGSVAMMLTTLILFCTWPKSSNAETVDVGRAKKEDVTQEDENEDGDGKAEQEGLDAAEGGDDDAEEEEEEEEEEEAEQKGPRRRAARRVD